MIAILYLQHVAQTISIKETYYISCTITALIIALLSRRSQNRAAEEQEQCENIHSVLRFLNTSLHDSQFIRVMMQMTVFLHTSISDKSNRPRANDQFHLTYVRMSAV
jgi:hypothetical protein